MLGPDAAEEAEALAEALADAEALEAEPDEELPQPASIAPAPTMAAAAAPPATNDLLETFASCTDISFNPFQSTYPPTYAGFTRQGLYQKK